MENLINFSCGHRRFALGDGSTCRSDDSEIVNGRVMCCAFAEIDNARKRITHARLDSGHGYSRFSLWQTLIDIQHTSQTHAPSGSKVTRL